MVLNEKDQERIRKELEGLIDSVGMAVTLDSLAWVCAVKAEHIEEHWQDAPLAKEWWDLSKRIGRIESSCNV